MSNNLCPNCGGINGQDCHCPKPVKIYKIVAHELLIHTYEVEAEDKEMAKMIALDGCPLMDNDCEMREFIIKTVKEIK